MPPRKQFSVCVEASNYKQAGVLIRWKILCRTYSCRSPRLRYIEVPFPDSVLSGRQFPVYPRPIHSKFAGIVQRNNDADSVPSQDPFRNIGNFCVSGEDFAVRHSFHHELLLCGGTHSKRWYGVEFLSTAQVGYSPFQSGQVYIFQAAFFPVRLLFSLYETALACLMYGV